jgi:hypothetical protein
VVLIGFLTVGLVGVTGGALFLGKLMNPDDEQPVVVNPPRSQRPDNVRQWNAHENGSQQVNNGRRR